MTRTRALFTVTRTRALFTATFWLDATERAIKSAAQAALGLWFVGDIVTGWASVNWGESAVAAVAGATLSLLTSIASAPVTATPSASLLPPPPPR